MADPSGAGPSLPSNSTLKAAVQSQAADRSLNLRAIRLHPNLATSRRRRESAHRRAAEVLQLGLDQRGELMGTRPCVRVGVAAEEEPAGFCIAGLN
jgi:hypothetical protein